MPKKADEALVLEEGIRVPLGGEWWILYSKEWNTGDVRKWKKASLIGAFKLLVEKALDWHFPDAQWQPIPFDKEKLIAACERAEWGEVKPEELLDAIGRVTALKTAVYASDEAFDAALADLSALRQRAIDTLDDSGMLSYPVQLELPVINSWWEARNAAAAIPLGKKLPSSNGQLAKA